MFTIPRAVFFHYFLTSYFKVLTVQSALPTQQAFHLPTFLKSEMLTKKKGRIVFKPDVAELLIPDCLLYILRRSDKELLFSFYMENLHFCNFQLQALVLSREQGCDRTAHSHAEPRAQV